MMCDFFFLFYLLFKNLNVTLWIGFKILTNWYHSMSLQIKHLVWKHFITISIFGLSYKVFCCQNFAFLNWYHTLCEGRNYQIYYNSTVRSRFICLLIDVTNWSKFWTSPMELLSDSILDKKNNKKKTYFIVESTYYTPL